VVPDGNEAGVTHQLERSNHTALLIVGAGPFGLAMAAHAQELGVDHVIIGRPMSFWKQHMPPGMLLRSACDWHLDPAGYYTIERFLETRGQKPSDVEPLSLPFYLDYADWFQRAKDIRPRSSWVTRLDQNDGRLKATLDDGTILTADRVLLALGFAPFAHIPDDLAALVPVERRSHSCDSVSFDRFAGQRVLMVGGRQSALEGAALLAEAGAAAVHVCHRHDTPAFAPSDWSWVGPLVEQIANEPGWYRRLPDSEREALNARQWQEGRLKLEPWLAKRVHRKAISIRPRTRLVGAEERGTALRVRLDSGGPVDVDHVLCATGYKVNLERVPCLKAGNLRHRIACHDGYPVLDDGLQTSVPGLFMTSLAATRDFGGFFGFTVAVRASARIVGRSLHRQLH